MSLLCFGSALVETRSSASRSSSREEGNRRGRPALPAPLLLHTKNSPPNKQFREKVFFYLDVLTGPVELHFAEHWERAAEVLLLHAAAALVARGEAVAAAARAKGVSRGALRRWLAANGRLRPPASAAPL